MPNMQTNKVPMKEQDPIERAANFKEVALGYTLEDAITEAKRCLQCKHMPCISGCPVSVRIPEFIKEIAEGNILKAYEIITSTNNLPAVCGRVCPQENQCEKYCVRGIKGEPVGIGRLERFAADYAMNALKDSDKKQTEAIDNYLDKSIENAKEGYNEANKNKKVAVIGSGPSSMTCAADLATMGYSVTVFEALHVAGGVLMYGIPEFRLPKAIVQAEIDKIKALGVDIQTNVVIGKTLTIKDIKDMGYEAVFIGSGAGLPSFLGIEGENLNGVYSANEFLTRINLMKAYDPCISDTPVFVGKVVAVVGGGNVAMDAARSAKRAGAETVYIVYRRSEDELPARAEEVHHAKEEGIIFKLLTNPKAIKGNEKGWVTSMECAQMELGEPDASGRRRPVEIKGSEFTIPVEMVIMAIGTSPNPLIKNTTQGLDTQKWGGILADESTGQTSLDGVFAGGDAVTGAATVILAMGAGKASAKAIDEYIKSK